MAGVRVLSPFFSNTSAASECEYEGSMGSLGLCSSSAKAELIL